MKKRITAFMLIVSLLFSATVLSGCEATSFAFIFQIINEIRGVEEGPDPYIEGIRTARQENYGVEYGETFDYFFTSPTWTSFVTDDNVYVVEFTGNCFFRGTPVDARIQFTILDDGASFKPTYLALNGVTQTEEIMNLLLANAFEAYLRSGR